MGMRIQSVNFKENCTIHLLPGGGRSKFLKMKAKMGSTNTVWPTIPENETNLIGVITRRWELSTYPTYIQDHTRRALA